ncbi:hypothetical protein GCM10023075_36320 [Streptosporangium album]
MTGGAADGIGAGEEVLIFSYMRTSGNSLEAENGMRPALGGVKGTLDDGLRRPANRLAAES